MQSNKLRVASLNVNGLNNPIKRAKIIAKMKKEEIQLINLQETHLSHNEHEKLKKFGYKNAFFSSFDRGPKRGVIILISNSLNFEVLKVLKDKEGRYVIVKGKIENSLWLMSMYPRTLTPYF